jgi:hypothetical protein
MIGGLGGSAAAAQAKKRNHAQCGLAVAGTPSEMADVLLKKWGKA